MSYVLCVAVNHVVRDKCQMLYQKNKRKKCTGRGGKTQLGRSHSEKKVLRTRRGSRMRPDIVNESGKE